MPRPHPLFALTLARLRQFVREPSAVFWTFGFPLLMTVALGIAFRTQGTPQTQVVVQDAPGAHEVMQVLLQQPRLSARLLPAQEAYELLKSGRAALVVLPEPKGVLRYRFDPDRPEAPLARALVDDAIQRASGRRDVRDTHDEVTSGTETRYIEWLIPGLLGMQLLNGSMWGMAFSIVDNRQRKLLKRFVATPMRRSHYLLSFILSRLVFICLEVPIILGFARGVFGVRIVGSSVALMVLSILAALSFCGIGLLCASRAQNTETANGWVNLVTLPMFILSGVFFSAQRFPSLIQPLIRVLPLTAFNEAARHVMNDGTSLFAQPFQLATLLVWGALGFGVALKIFRWT